MNAAPTHIRAVREQAILTLTWPEGSATVWPFKKLRCSCRCAACVDEYTGVRILDPTTVPEDVAIQNMELVGAYALRITWSDGHSTGLYTWEHLRAASGTA
jgi:DUF971 family protein